MSIPISLGTISQFSPRNISGLKLWLRADTLSLANGAAVSSFNDSSSSGNTFTQATGGLQPVFESSITNGLPVIRFVTSNRLTGATLTEDANYTFFVTFIPRIDTGGPSYTTLLADSIGYGFFIYNNRQVYYSMVTHNTSAGGASACPVGTLVTFIYVRSGVNMNFVKNGISEGIVNVGSTAEVLLNIGSDPAGDPGTFDFCEMGYFSEAFSQSQINELYGYLKRWGTG